MAATSSIITLECFICFRYSERTAPKSFIHVDDFSTVQALADFLQGLDKNETAYMEYLDWKFEYRRVCETQNPFCDICKRIYEVKGRG